MSLIKKAIILLSFIAYVLSFVCMIILIVTFIKAELTAGVIITIICEVAYSTYTYSRLEKLDEMFQK